MPIEVRKSGKVNVLDISGKVTLGTEEVRLRQVVEELLAAGERLFVLNMTHVSFLDSAGLGEAVSCAKKVLDQGGRIRLVMISTGKPAKLFQVTSLDRVFEIYETEPEALASLVP